MDTDWIILRTSGRHTMGLAESLAADGYEAWTPIETKKVWIAKAGANRQIRLPIMPSYVFAKATHLVDLLQLAAMPVKPRRGAGFKEAAHAGFSVLHAFGRIPLVADRHLTRLRQLEARRTPVKRAAYSFPRNASARVNGGICGGMVGVVVRSTPKATVLQILGGKQMEIPTSLLELDGVSDVASAALQAA